MNTQDWSPLGWTAWISLQSKGLSGVFSNTTVEKHQFFSAQPFSQFFPGGAEVKASACNISQNQGLFLRVIPLHQVAKVLELQLQHQSF